jgi:phosphatidylinositol glycan class B
MHLLSEHLRSQIGLDDPAWIKFLKKWLFFSLGLHLIAGLMSTGFYDVDEHFQIVEFVSYKLGHSPASALPHEFLENCRSWLQPSLYEALARTWRALGIVSPAFWAASFRIFSGLLGWLGLVGMALCAYRWFPQRKYRELSVKLGALLYFLPYLHARTSSENLGGNFFVLAVAALILLSKERPKKNPVTVHSNIRTSVSAISITDLVAGTVGLLLGLSFLSRFQMGFMIFGLGIWCLLIARIHFKSLTLIFLGIAASVGIGIILDWRGTGVWTLSPYNYFFSFQKAAESPNVSVFPWWGYFQFLAGDVPLLGNLIAAGVIAGWIAQPKNPLCFAALPFVLIHMAIPHKEPRYLFPLISAVPTFLTFGIEIMDRALLKGKELNTILPQRWIKNGVIFLNAGGLLVATLKPAAIQPLLHSYIFDHAEEIPKLNFIESNPFELNGLALNFYRPPHLEVIQTSYSKLAKKLKDEKQPQWLFYPQLQLPPEAEALKENCKLQYTVFPNWLKPFLFLPGIRISNKASLYKCVSR